MRRNTCCATSREGLDGRVKSCVDLAERLLGDTLADGGNLGHDGVTEGGGGGLLVGQLGGDDRRHAELVEDGLLGDEVLHGRVGGGGEAGGGLLQGQGVCQGEGVGALDLCGGGLDGVLCVGAGAEDTGDAVGVLGVDALDGCSEPLKGCLDGADGLLDGCQVPLVQGWGRDGGARKERGQECELHCCCGITWYKVAWGVTGIQCLGEK